MVSPDHPCPFHLRCQCDHRSNSLAKVTHDYQDCVAVFICASTREGVIFKALIETPKSVQGESSQKGIKDFSCFLSVLLPRTESKAAQDSVNPVKYSETPVWEAGRNNNSLRIICFSSQEQPKYIIRKLTLTRQQFSPEVAWEKGPGLTEKKHMLSCKYLPVMLPLRTVWEPVCAWCP